MNTADLISVIIPAYNHEDYIEECLRSIIDQTYRNIELLIVDDGSTDGTFAKMQKMKPECEKRFVRVVMETQKNRGRCFTDNKLIDLAKGTYLYLIASDDRAKPQAIETLHDFLSRNPDYVLAVGDNEIVNASSERIYWGKHRETVPESEAVYKTFGDELLLNGPDGKHPDFGGYESLLKGNYIPNGYLYSRQSIVNAGKMNPGIFLEDWYLHLQLAKRGKYKYIPEILFSYRWHVKNTVLNPAFRDKALEVYRQIYEHEKEYCFTHGFERTWKRQWCKRFGWRAKWKNVRDFFKGKNK